MLLNHHFLFSICVVVTVSAELRPLPVFGCFGLVGTFLSLECSFVSAAVKQSGGSWELQRPSTTAPLPSSTPRTENNPNHGLQRFLMRHRQTVVKVIACMKHSLKLQCRIKLRCVEEIKE